MDGVFICCRGSKATGLQEVCSTCTPVQHLQHPCWTKFANVPQYYVSFKSMHDCTIRFDRGRGQACCLTASNTALKSASPKPASTPYRR